MSAAESKVALSWFRSAAIIGHLQVR
jgi:hypothetical protein